MKEKKNKGKLTGLLKVSLISSIVFSLGFLPLVVYAYFVLFFIPFDQTWQFLLLPFLVYVGFGITLFYQFLISGLFIHIFGYKYESGVYPYVYSNKTAFKWIVVCTLYTPMRKMLEIFPMGGMKLRYYRMLGMKIGENTLVGGTIMDPCLTEFGDNCTMGLFSCIYGHIHDYEKETLTLGRIKIGNNVIIGAGVFIMPGAIVEDDVKIATGAVVTKGQVLEKGRIYAGIPAREIKKK